MAGESSVGRGRMWLDGVGYGVHVRDMDLRHTSPLSLLGGCTQCRHERSTREQAS